MSDYHIRKVDHQYKSATVVFHIPIPGAGNNEAGLQWRAALLEELIEQALSNQRAGVGDGTIQSVLPNIGAEIGDLQNGSKLEETFRVDFSKTNLTPAQRRAEIETVFNARSTQVLAEKQIVLEWMGYEANAV